MTKAIKSDPVLINDAPSARTLRSLREWIKAGRLPAGERLPSENALAEKLQVTRASVRAALRELTRERLICSVGKKRVVSSNEPPVTRSLMADTVAIISHVSLSDASIRNESGWSNQILAGILEEIWKHDLHAMVLQPGRLQDAEIEHLISDKPRGIVVQDIPLARPDILDGLKHKGIPIVIYGDEIENPEYDRVVSDHHAGGYNMTRWLIERGCKRILCYCTFHAGMGDFRPAWYKWRFAGYQRAMKESGLEALPIVDYINPDFHQHGKAEFEMNGRMAAGFLFEYLQGPNPVDAVMSFTDGIIFPIAEACRLLGKNVNRDVAIVGYDNYWAGCHEYNWGQITPIATADKLNRRIGQELLKLLLDRVEGRLGAAQERRVIVPELRVIDENWVLQKQK